MIWIDQNKDHANDFNDRGKVHKPPDPIDKDKLHILTGPN